MWKPFKASTWFSDRLFSALYMSRNSIMGHEWFNLLKKINALEKVYLQNFQH